MHRKKLLILYLKFYLKSLFWLGLFVIIGLALISVWISLILYFAFGWVTNYDDILYSLFIPMVIVSLCAAKCEWDILSKFGQTKLKK